MSNCHISLLDEKNAPRWDEFVMRCPDATFFHRSGWKDVIEQAFGHHAYFFYAEQDGRIQGILPLGHINSWLFGNALISVPFCVYGGICADSDEIAQDLCMAAERLGGSLGVDYIEMRQRTNNLITWSGKDLYVTFRKNIDPDPDKNLLAIPRKQRAMIRKGIKAGLCSEVDDGIGRFYDAYSESVRNLGTPVFSRRYFQVLADTFGDDCQIMTVSNKGRTVASVMSFYFKDEVLPYYGGGTQEARHCKANDFMYWELMRRASESGVSLFDYGRSKKDTGAYSFKKNWGFEPQPLHYKYRLVNSTELPDINPLNPKYRLFIKAWERLPLTVSRIIGPMISRNLG